jgi:hypothetical protein
VYERIEAEEASPATEDAVNGALERLSQSPERAR